MTSAWSRTLWGGTNYNPASRFLKEVPAELVDTAGKRTRSKSAERFGSGPSHTVSSSEIQSGDRVRHDKWGDGTVREVIGGGDRAEAVVLFDDAGRRRLLLAWAPLEKL
jgi:DNA helicase-2/ATP-dependent DNA helicase PcrA